MNRARTRLILIPALLLCILFGLAAGSSLHWSPTFDEGFYIARGWAFLKTGTLLPLGHPPLTNVLSGLGVLLEPGLPDPRTLDGWQEREAEAFSEDLLWRRGLKVERVVFLARLPIIWLGLLLGAVVWRWGLEEYGPAGAALGLGLFTFCPNVIAHTALATTDLGVAAFYVMAVYSWMRYLRRRSGHWLIISGVAFGLAQASKFSAVFLGLTLLLMSGRQVARRRETVGRALWALIQMGLVGLVALWSSYLFAIRPYPLAAYVSEFQHFLSLASAGHRAYLMGHFSQSGWWWYHPFTLLVKLPLVTLGLIALAAGLAVWRGLWHSEWAIIFPALLYLGLSMMTSLNVGIRYLLPALPLLFVFAGRVMAAPIPGRLKAGIGGLALAGLIGANILIYPDYLAFFNLAVGGPDQGYRYLVDSNLDWGQDLPALADYLQERGVDEVYLSYFGQADPAYYGIQYQALPAWPPAPLDLRVDFHPLDPASGMYAISVSNLVGVQLYEPESFGYFLAQEPVAQIGHSILVYEVATHEDQPTWFAQCAIPAPDGGWIAEPAETEEQLAELTGLDGLEYLYFDCQQSLFFRDEPGWLLIPNGVEPPVSPGSPDFLSRHPDGSPDYAVWRVAQAPSSPEPVVESPAGDLPISIDRYAELIGYTVSGGAQPGGTLSLTLWWRVIKPPPPPVSFLAHLLKPDGSLLVGADGLGIAAEHWQPGMEIVQRHIFAIPPDAPPGDYRLAVGLYSLATGERFEVEGGGDTIILRIVTLGGKGR